MDVAKWLWKISKRTIDIHADNEHAFQISCRDGHLDVAKWLWKLSDETIDIHAENEYAFRYSCDHSHRDVAKWLCDIYLDERYILRYTALDNDLYIELCSRNKRIIDNINDPHGKSDMIERFLYAIEAYGLRLMINNSRQNTNMNSECDESLHKNAVR